MMLVVLGYLTLISALLAVAGILLERTNTLCQLPRRWCWLAVIVAVCVASAAVPFRREAAAALLPSVNIGASPEIDANPASSFAQGVSNSVTAPSAPAVEEPLPPRFDLDALNGPIATLWAGTTALLVIIGAIGQLRLHQRRREWQTASLHGVEVLLSQHDGPATIGVLRPRILLPQWVLTLDDSAQRLIIAHEEEHIRAGDSRISRMAISVAALLPWNLPLWWMLRRLGLAIEVDCDQRVLHRRTRSAHQVPALAHYAEVLLLVAKQRTEQALELTPAFAGRTSLLQARIEAMTALPHRFRKLQVGVVAVALLMFTVLAAKTPAPRLEAQTNSAVAPFNVIRIFGQRNGAPQPPSSTSELKALVQRYRPKALTVNSASPFANGVSLLHGLAVIRQADGTIADTIDMALVAQLVRVLHEKTAPLRTTADAELPFEYATPQALALATARWQAGQVDDSLLRKATTELNRSHNNAHAKLLALPRLKPGEKATPAVRASWDSVAAKRLLMHEVGAASGMSQFRNARDKEIVKAEQALANAGANRDSLRRLAQSAWIGLVNIEIATARFDNKAQSTARARGDTTSTGAPREPDISDAARQLAQQVRAIDVVHMPTGALWNLPATIYVITKK